jgi:hypothetical protein
MNVSISIDRPFRVIKNGDNINAEDRTSGSHTFTSVSTLELRELGVSAGVTAPTTGEGAPEVVSSAPQGTAAVGSDENVGANSGQLVGSGG